MYCFLRSIFLLLFTQVCLFVSAQVTVIITSVSNNTPPNDTLFLAGTFNNWNPGNPQFRFNKTGNNYIQTIAITPSNPMKFKVTRGSWAKVEGNASGGFIPDRSYQVSSGDTISISVAGWEDLGSGNPCNSTANSNVGVLSEQFFMPQLNRNRKIRIYLPSNYAQSNNSYPVIYFHDGQNIFDQCTSFSGEWQVDETLKQLENEGYYFIAVGIDNGGSDRIAEYTPWVNTQYGGGEGAAYTSFIVNNLKPYVDANYRTKSDRENTCFFGSSLGAHISLYAGLAHQNTIGKLGLFSPAFWINNEMYAMAGNFDKQQETRIFLLAGGQESAGLYQQVNRMVDSLTHSGFALNTELNKVFKSDGQHSEWFWRRELKDAVKWLFANSTTGKSEKGNKKLELYPNPASQLLTIKGLENQNLSYSIYDSTGKLHVSGNISGESISVAQLKPGKYVLNIATHQSLHFIKP